MTKDVAAWYIGLGVMACVLDVITRRVIAQFQWGRRIIKVHWQDAGQVGVFVASTNTDSSHTRMMQACRHHDPERWWFLGQGRVYHFNPRRAAARRRTRRAGGVFSTFFYKSAHNSGARRAIALGKSAFDSSFTVFLLACPQISSKINGLASREQKVKNSRFTKKNR